MKYPPGFQRRDPISSFHPTIPKIPKYNMPQDWNDAYIIPIHKGSSRDEDSSYQPVSLTSGVGKLLQGIVKLSHHGTSKCE